MFRHILLPTDGSELSASTLKKAVQFAKSLGARVTGLCVIQDIHYAGCEADIGQEFQRQAEAAVNKKVEENLLAIEQAAREAGVPCETEKIKSLQVVEAIVNTAGKKGCDLIIMASHGRKGVGALLLGSETQKVLTHSKIPVLVYR